MIIEIGYLPENEHCPGERGWYWWLCGENGVRASEGNGPYISSERCVRALAAEFEGTHTEECNAHDNKIATAQLQNSITVDKLLVNQDTVLGESDRRSGRRPEMASESARSSKGTAG